MRRNFSRSGSGDRHRREVTFAIESRGPAFRVSNIWSPLAAVFFEVVVAIEWSFALSNLEGKFKGCGNTTSNVVRYREFLFGCCGWARWYHHVNRIPDVIVNKNYMDDNATGGIGLSWAIQLKNYCNPWPLQGF